MCPALLMPAEAPSPVKAILPARKSASVMSSVEATKPPPVWIEPCGVMAIPFGLTRYTVPFALISPAIVELVLPVTRFSVALWASG